MRPIYAIRARQLLEQRQQGQRPDGIVQVTLAPGQQAGMVLRVADDMPADRLDWRMLVDLQVWLWATPETALSRVLAIARGIAKARPEHLILRFDAGEIHDVEVGCGTHRRAVLDIPAEHSFTWKPINLCGSVVGASLRNALMAEIPAFEVL